jgi:hypothetical protein
MSGAASRAERSHFGVDTAAIAASGCALEYAIAC